jgi:hypothetical protein
MTHQFIANERIDVGILQDRGERVVQCLRCGDVGQADAAGQVDEIVADHVGPEAAEITPDGSGNA